MSSLDVLRTGQQPVSLVAHAYEAIKHRIFTVVYAPGAYLNEVTISRELEIGRIKSAPLAYMKNQRRPSNPVMERGARDGAAGPPRLREDAIPAWSNQ